MELTDDLHSFPWERLENNCNVFYFGGDVKALVDVGHLLFVDDLVRRLRAVGIDPSEIRMVIATHSHPDHIEGITRFTDSGVPVGMHPAAEQYLREDGGLIYQFLASDVPDFEVTHTLEEGPIQALDGAIEVYHTPGHEPGSLCVYWPEKKALATGDLIFAGGVGRTDFPGGNHATLMAQIERISALEVEYLLPGHGPILQGKDRVRRNYHNVRRMFG